MNIKLLIKDRYRRTLFFARLSVPYNAVMAAGKIIMGLYIGSVFLAINSLYNVGMGLIRALGLKTDKQISAQNLTPEEKMKMQNDFFMTAGGILMVCSAVYMIFSVRLFLGHKSMDYTMLMGLVIAFVTFVEIIISIVGVIVTRSDKRPIIEAIKLVNLACAIISLVLTQTAIMSFAAEGDNSTYNGMSGMIFGGIAALIGLYMVLRAAWVQSKAGAKGE